jgi:oxygen-independent coproporphyrinogen-3 oxidase
MAGIYIHIPFCKQACTYCDFHFSTTFEKYRDAMVNAICTELIARKESLDGQVIDTIYFGGGTPSLLTLEELCSILDTINTHFEVHTEAEITLEANPDDIDTTKAQEWVRAGVNRLSIGLQSFHAESLEWMNRAHTVAQSVACIPIAQHAGIRNISIDLIYGLPNMGNEVWVKEIQTALQLGVQHISAYCLTVEPNTVLSSLVKKEKIQPASNELQNEHFTILQKELLTAGFEHYEISNFALPNFISKHNSSYWKGAIYLGVGPSAHSYDGKYRSWNVANNQRYIQGIENKQPEFDFELLTKENQFNELLLTGLRAKWGVSLVQLGAILPLDNSFLQQLEILEKKGWVFCNENTVYLTQEGKSWADKIAQDLFV